jgi:hypothetical protein
LEAGEPCSAQIHQWTSRERELDVIDKARLCACGFEAVVVNPAPEGAFPLFVREETVLLVLRMDGDPLFLERAKRHLKHDARAGLKPGVLVEYTRGLPWGSESLERSRRLVELEDAVDGRVNQ